MDHCLFHSARPQFDKMVRSVQQAKIIPKQFAGRLAMAVCSCRKKKINVCALMTEKELHDKMLELKDRLCVEKDWPDSLIDYFYQVLSDDISLEHDSKCRFIYVIHQAIIYNNYDMLTRAAVSSNIQEVKPVKKLDNKPLPKHVVDIIIRRKMRKANIQRKLSLSMFPGNLKSLQECPDFVELVAENKNNVNIVFNHSENTKHMKNNNNQTEAMVAGGDEKIIKEFCEALKKLAINQQKKMDTRYKAIKERRSRRRKHVFNVTMTTDYDDVNNDTNLKDELADNYAFTRKKLWQKKSQASGQKTANQSVLMGGHCLSCLKPFNGLKTELREKDPCIYHPGYTYFNIEDSTIRWTCCDEQALDDKPTPEDHSQTGCCSGNHIWRPHKKVSRKPGVNHKEENVGDIAKKLVNQNSVGMSSKNVLSVYNSWFT